MCTNPITITIRRKETNEEEEVTVPCGQCATCLKKRARDWTIKLINEAKYHKEACFITLTFDNAILTDKNSKAVKKYGAQANFPYNVTYSKKYFQKFIKRLRAKFPDKIITYYHVGEYGEKTGRAHHHVLLFGCDFREDAIQVELSKSGKSQYYSDTLNDLWACGRTRIQYINDYNIAYIAGYNTKKWELRTKNIYWARPKRSDYEDARSYYDDLNLFWINWKKKTETHKPIQSFSNRSKMSSKFIRKRPEMIFQDFLTDRDNKKYGFPKSYIRELEKEYKRTIEPNKGYTTNSLFIQAFDYNAERREDLIKLYHENSDFFKNQELIKEKIAEIRQSKTKRDF